MIDKRVEFHGIALIVMTIWLLLLSAVAVYLWIQCEGNMSGSRNR